ncbi:ABC transporter permease [Amycolatopsis nigrescens]|uniref:ABC transporter permease n=1 Tax=Amycolatopsis nigrescens TaxID=381445 RepID=UPI00037A4794|nr:ABC transporter permease subunit [Amycolatopsis nigrescens]
MTATAVRPAAKRVGWGDLLWIGWRQHRLMLAGTGVLTLGLAAVMTALGLYAASTGDVRASILGFSSVTGTAQLAVAAVMGYSALIAVFWAAPLLAREYEQRTHLLVWSQDVSAARWLIGKATLLTVVAVALSLVLGTASNVMMHQINAAKAGDYPSFNLFDTQYFEVVPLVQAGYALFGFALGLAVSALSRRTVLSMGVTFGIFFVVRGAIAQLVRPYYQPPVRVTYPLDGQTEQVYHTLYVSSGMLDAAGNPVEYPTACNRGYSDADGYRQCLTEQGVVSNYRDFQPTDRLGTFQLIEFGIYTVLAAGLFVLAWSTLRRVSRL